MILIFGSKSICLYSVAMTLVVIFQGFYVCITCNPSKP